MWLHVLLRETGTTAARRSDASYSLVVPSQHQRIPCVLPIGYSFLPALISGDPQSLKRLSLYRPTGTSLVPALRLVDNFVESVRAFPTLLTYIPFGAPPDRWIRKSSLQLPENRGQDRVNPSAIPLCFPGIQVAGTVASPPTHCLFHGSLLRR